MVLNVAFFERIVMKNTMKILSRVVLIGFICALFSLGYTTTYTYAEDEPTPPAPTIHTVTYKVVNGKWNDDSTGDKSETTEDNGYLHNIPAVGNKPSSGFKAGSWAPSTPTDTTVITENKTFTYTYAEDEPTPPAPTTHTVTYKVVNGKWNDDSTGDKSETVEDNGHPANIPAVGNKPSSGFKAGSWSPSTPNTTTSITGDVTYTYTYAQDEPTPPSPTVYKVTLTTDGHGEAYANKRSGVSGTKVMLKELPDDGYRFKQWEVVSGGVELDNYRDYTTSFEIKNADVEIKAHFEREEEHTRENDYRPEESKSEAAWTPEKAAATIAAEKAAKQQAAETQLVAVQTFLRTLATKKPTDGVGEARKVIVLDMTKVDILDPTTVNLLLLNNRYAFYVKISVPGGGGLTTTIMIPANFDFRPFIKADGTMNLPDVLSWIISKKKPPIGQPIYEIRRE